MIPSQRLRVRLVIRCLPTRATAPAGSFSVPLGAGGRAGAERDLAAAPAVASRLALDPPSTSRHALSPTTKAALTPRRTPSRATESTCGVTDCPPRGRATAANAGFLTRCDRGDEILGTARTRRPVARGGLVQALDVDGLTITRGAQMWILDSLSSHTCDECFERAPKLRGEASFGSNVSRGGPAGRFDRGRLRNARIARDPPLASSRRGRRRRGCRPSRCGAAKQRSAVSDLTGRSHRSVRPRVPRRSRPSIGASTRCQDDRQSTHQRRCRHHSKSQTHIFAFAPDCLHPRLVHHPACDGTSRLQDGRRMFLTGSDVAAVTAHAARASEPCSFPLAGSRLAAPSAGSRP